MKGTLTFINDKWCIRYSDDNDNLIIYKTIPISKFDIIMYKNNLKNLIDCEVEFETTFQNDYISYCNCKEQEHNDCEYFVKSGINECLNYENKEVLVGKITYIKEHKGETFSREFVKNIIIEVKNRFGTIGTDNYISDIDVIDWFDRNYPKK